MEAQLIIKDIRIQDIEVKLQEVTRKLAAEPGRRSVRSTDPISIVEKMKFHGYSCADNQMAEQKAATYTRYDIKSKGYSFWP